MFDYDDREKEMGAIFGIIWQLAKLDGEPIQIGNSVFNPIPQDEGRGFDRDYFQVRIAYLRAKAPFQEATEYLKTRKESQARELLKFHYPDLRSMRPVMWDELFRVLLTPMNEDKDRSDTRSVERPSEPDRIPLKELDAIKKCVSSNPNFVRKPGRSPSKELDAIHKHVNSNPEIVRRLLSSRDSRRTAEREIYNAVHPEEPLADHQKPPKAFQQKLARQYPNPKRTERPLRKARTT